MDRDQGRGPVSRRPRAAGVAGPYVRPGDGEHLPPLAAAAFVVVGRAARPLLHRHRGHWFGHAAGVQGQGLDGEPRAQGNEIIQQLVDAWMTSIVGT